MSAENSSVASSPPASPPSGRTPESADLRARERQEGWAVPLDPIEAFTLGAPIAVEPDRIEQELAGLWRKAAERAQKAGEGSRFTVTRACLWNLIVHSDGEGEFQRSKRMIDELSESVPARIINLYEPEESPSELIGDDGSPLRASVEANFRRSGSGRREVLAEEITLEAPRVQAQRLPGLVRSLLLADVPTALFVRNPIADYKWLPRLAPEADRFIFDSGKLADGQALKQVYTQLTKLYRDARIEIADLGWLRLWPWRILMAALFDPQAATQALSRLDTIEIHHGAGAEPAAQLLAGWLLSRLRLLPVAPAPSGGFTCAAAERSAGPVRGKVSLRLIESAAAPAAAVGIMGIGCVVMRSGEHAFTARGIEGSRCISLVSPFQPERVQPVHGRPDSELMVAAMGVGGRDPLMYEALRLAAKLVRAEA